jgi:DNA-binding IclR family transcriptional regulator
MLIMSKITAELPPTFTLAEYMETMSASYNTAYRALNRLVERGELSQVAPNTYSRESGVLPTAPLRDRILGAIRELDAPTGVNVAQIAAHLGISESYVRRYIGVIKRDRQITHVGRGRYRVAQTIVTKIRTDAPIGERTEQPQKRDRILALLHKAKAPMTLRELGTRTGASETYVLKTLNRLTKAGIARKVARGLYAAVAR